MMDKNLEKKMPSMTRWCRLCSLVFVLLFFILNVLTPLTADDYTYSLGINSFHDVVESTYNLYFSWGGRLVTHFTESFWSFAGKDIFNIANTAVYCLFVLLVQFHLMGKIKFNPIMFLMISIFLWLFVPVWGQNFLWLVGSCTYLWTTTLILLFIVPFRKKYDDANYKLNLLLSVLFFFLGLLAGCGTENAGAAVLFLLIAYFTVKVVNRNKIALFEILGTLGFLVGFFTLVLAPGNYARQGLLNHWGSESFMALKRLVGVTLIFGKDLGFILIAICAILAFDLVCNKKQKLNKFSCFYMLAAVVGAYSMLLSPSFPPRSFFIVTVFSGIAFGHILLQTEVKLPEMIKRNMKAILVCGLIALSFSVLNSSRNFIGVYLEWNNRIKYIEAEKAKNNFDIELRAPIPVWDKHVAMYGLRDISHNKDEWPNTDIAKYFGLSSIKKIDDEWETMWFK